MLNNGPNGRIKIFTESLKTLMVLKGMIPG